ncbi:MAG: hypothetical protein ACYS0I_16005 [Planctomycetota bacterium]|jgi:hypothetical protein
MWRLNEWQAYEVHVWSYPLKGWLDQGTHRHKPGETLEQHRETWAKDFGVVRTDIQIVPFDI